MTCFSRFWPVQEKIADPVSSDLSYTALQYQTHGYITNSIIIVDIFHVMYVVDFFINESW